MSQNRFSIQLLKQASVLCARIERTVRYAGRAMVLLVLLCCAGGLAPSGGVPHTGHDEGSATIDPVALEGRTLLDAPKAFADGRPDPLPSTPQFHITESPLVSTNRWVGRSDMAWSTKGELYVVEKGRHAVMRFDAQARAIDRWGGAGWAAGRFESPRAIEVAPNGTVWVLDAGGRLQAFDPFGIFERSLAVGPEVLDFILLEDGHLNLILVTGRVRRIDGEGHPLGEWAIEAGTPLAAAGRSGRGLWFLTAGGRRILHYDRHGERLGERRVETVDEELPRHPDLALAVGPAGELAVYVAGRDVHVAWAPDAPFEAIRSFGVDGMDFDPDGRLWQSFGNGHGMTVIERDRARNDNFPWNERIQTFAVPWLDGDSLDVRDVAAHQDHTVLALYPAGFRQFDRFGRRLSSWRDPALPTEDAAAEQDAAGYQRIAVALDGTRWLSSPDRLVGVSSAGEAIHDLRWSDLLGPGDVAAEAGAPAIACASDGRLVAVDVARGLLLRMNVDGTDLETWDHPVLHGLETPHITLLVDGEIAVLGKEQPEILRFAPDGRRLGTWRLPSDALPTAIVGRPGGGALVAERGRPSLLGLSAEGQLLFRRTSGAQSSSGPLSSPITALAIGSMPESDDGEGPGSGEADDPSLFAAAGRDIARATVDGRFLQAWMMEGPGSVWDVGGVAWTADETLFVSARSGRVVFRYDRYGHLIGHWPIQATPTPLHLGRSQAASESPILGARLASPAARYSGIDVGPEGQICPVAPDARAILCFDPEGRLLDRIGTSSANGEPLSLPGYGWAGDVAIADDGMLWIAERDRVSGIRPNGRLVETTFPESEREDWPRGLAVAPDGGVFVSTYDAIRRYGPDGSLMRTFGFEADDPSTSGSGGLDVHAGSLHAVHGRISRMSLDGALLDTWGEGPDPWPRDVAWSRGGRAAVSAARSIAVYPPEADDSWNAAYAAQRWSLDSPVWRTGVASPHLPGPTPPFGDAIRDPAWRFRRLVQRDGEPARRWRIQVTGHVRLRADDALLLDAYSAEPVTYEGAMTFASRGTLVELEYASRGGPESLDFAWLPWEAVERVHLPVVVR